MDRNLSGEADMAGGTPELQGLDLWKAARRISGRYEFEWTYPIHLARALAMEEVGAEEFSGLNLAYESVSSWDDTIDTLQIRDVLEESDVPESILPNVNLGLQIFDGTYRAPGGHLSKPKEGEPFRGRHSVSVTGFDGVNLIFVNTWGPDWGDSGAGYISRAFFEEHVDAVWIFRASWAGPSAAMDESIRLRSWTSGRGGSVAPRDFISSWIVPNRPKVKTLSLNGQEHQVKMRQLLALHSEVAPLEIFQLSRPDGTIVGRCHVLYPRDRDSAMIEELFVRPEARRSGYGSAILRLAIERAEVWKRHECQILVHEADEEIPAREFMNALGFKWHVSRERRPNLIARGFRREDD